MPALSLACQRQKFVCFTAYFLRLWQALSNSVPPRALRAKTLLDVLNFLDVQPVRRPKVRGPDPKGEGRETAAGCACGGAGLCGAAAVRKIASVSEKQP
ncbi:MAG TPA: hypothetical protein VFF89_09675, partial [Sphingobium sp.]|nr:hypothetical protein [Sphingobium sp.]